HEAIQTGGVRFSSETDSINASVLGPDAAPGTPEFEAYVRGLVTEMTSKAGQKCTAIRRALVPNEFAEELIDAVRARLEAKIVVGDPRAQGTTMGALASTGQRAEVLAQVRKLIDGGGRVVIGGRELAEPAGENAGAFLEPILLRFDDAQAPRVHDTEAFGPVSSVLTYDGSAAEAAHPHAPRGHDTEARGPVAPVRT